MKPLSLDYLDVLDHFERKRGSAGSITIYRAGGEYADCWQLGHRLGDCDEFSPPLFSLDEAERAALAAARICGATLENETYVSH